MFLSKIFLFVSCFYFACGFFPHYRKNILRKYHVTPLKDSSEIEAKWIEQPVDHFNTSDDRTWKMRYFENLDMWKPNGPVYLFIEGEAKADSDLLLDDWFIMYELANETGGAMFLSEHRYYGESKPFENYTTENLFYLSSRQALADVENLLKNITSSSAFESSKVVVVGSSYSGNLATWMRLLYPNLVDAVIASSAPLLAKTDFVEYLEKVSDVFDRYGTLGCVDRIVDHFQRIADLLKTDEGIKILTEEEQICNSTDMSQLENQQLFFLQKAWRLSDAVQDGNLDTVVERCEEIDNGTFKYSYLKHASWNEEDNCVDSDFNTSIEDIKNDEDNEDLLWFYQTCSEFGYFQTSNTADHPLTDNFSIEYYYKACIALFGPEFDEKRVNRGVENTNKVYGGMHPNVTNVVFVNGELDPWSRLGILQIVPYGSKAVYIPHASHSTEMDTDDTDDLDEARQYIKHLVKKWIALETPNYN